MIKKNNPVSFFFFLLLMNGALAQNAPVTTAQTIVTSGTAATINISVVDFVNIASFNLRLNYDPSIATLTGYNVYVSGGYDVNTSVPGVFIISWYRVTGITVPDNSNTLSLNFSMAAPGQTALTWYDTGTSCSYGDGNFVILNDTPTSTYYIDGSLSFAQPVTADFSAGNLTPPKNTTVTFTNLSTGGATAWSWVFSPSSVNFVEGTTASSKNPKIQFTAGGLYTISLTASNALFSDSETKVDYIRAGTSGLWTGAVSVEWATAGNWDNLLTPLSNTDVTVPANANLWPVVPGNLTIGSDCNSVTLLNNGQLTVSGDIIVNPGKTLAVTGEGTLHVGGSWYNAGNFISGNGTVDFFGSNAANIMAGPVTTAFYNLNVTKSVSASLHVLTNIIVNGNLNLNP